MTGKRSATHGTLHVPIAAHSAASANAGIVTAFGRTTCRFRIAGGPHHGALGERAGAAVTDSLRLAGELGVPVVGVLDTSGAELSEGVAALHAWGRIAAALAQLSGRVPVIIVLSGPCVSGPSLLLGIADAVVMTRDAFAYLSGPQAVREVTGVAIDRRSLGGVDRHVAQTGVASLVAADIGEALELAEVLLGYLPDNHLSDPVHDDVADPAERATVRAAAAVPDRPSATYDIRTVVGDVMDADSLLELRGSYAPNLVTALARLDGHAVGVVANQPLTRAGTLDIEASRKAARFVAFCDAFNLPLITFVDTPGFEPGRDLEWRGMIRHGAELVHAYCAASVPRICVVIRKAYGGAYIVMDSRGIGNDLCVAWPGAEIAVMGAAGAVQILHGKRLASLDEPKRRAHKDALADEYEATFLNPYRAAERGLVDMVVEPADTRAVASAALGVLLSKRTLVGSRKHSNPPQ